METGQILLEPTFRLACEMVLHEYTHGDYPQPCAEVLHKMYETLVKYERLHAAYIRTKCGTII